MSHNTGSHLPTNLVMQQDNQSDDRTIYRKELMAALRLKPTGLSDGSN